MFEIHGYSTERSIQKAADKAMLNEPHIGAGRFQGIRSVYRNRARHAWKQRVAEVRAAMPDRHMGTRLRRRFCRNWVEEETSGVKRDGAHTRIGIVASILRDRDHRNATENQEK